MGQEPGRPLPIQEQHQIARAAAVPTAPVRVVAQAPAIAPTVNRAPAPARGAVAQRPAPAAVPQAAPRAAYPTPAYQPPAGQQPVVRVPAPAQQVGRPVEPAPTQRPAYQPPQQVGRPVEPTPTQRPSYQPPQ